MKSNLSYFLIGDISTKNIIGTYELNHISFELKDKAREIFSNIKNFEKKGKLEYNSNTYYSAIRKNIFLLAVVSEIDEKMINEMFEDIDNQKIWKYVDNNNQLTNVGKQNLQFLINKYQKSDKLNETASDINEVKLEMKTGIKKMLHNFEVVKDLDSKADKIKGLSDTFKRDSILLNKSIWWRNMRVKIFLGTLVLSIIIYVIYLILS